ncbi:hypothetical protein FA15DRAFT_644604 [Coprinopsis marcescibilis]|uniref:PHD-type domain-containing protein n=1 Tax=Coprinopsis marcescibilis TaxID=230819 RepID=A0A5C3KNN6_COPMA|nr:hypothetical protein FA15DRAFT_644604 [Coprinopsis marcescibilis]
MPESRNAESAHVVAGTATPFTTDNGVLDGTDVDGEADTIYCFCNGVGSGEMIACDEGTCEMEWFHMACTGLSAPPRGKWYCGGCKSKRNAKRNAQRNTKRAGGG